MAEVRGGAAPVLIGAQLLVVVLYGMGPVTLDRAMYDHLHDLAHRGHEAEDEREEQQGAKHESISSRPQLRAQGSEMAFDRVRRYTPVHPEVTMRMSNKRRALFDSAIADGRQSRKAGRLDEAFASFERAHVIGQLWIVPHLIAHCEMLRVGWMRLDLREVAGQIMRLALVIPGTVLGRLPEGNTGGADVNAFRPMPIGQELARLLSDADR